MRRVILLNSSPITSLSFTFQISRAKIKERRPCLSKVINTNDIYFRRLGDEEIFIQYKKITHQEEKKMKLLLIILSISLLSRAAANDEVEEKMNGESTAEMTSKQVGYQGHASYEYFSPKERDNYDLNGINIGFQYDYRIEGTQTSMLMGPNLSLFTKDITDIEEDLIFVKWDQGIAYNIDIGGNMLLQPLAMIGVGYGWLNSTRPYGQSQNDENAPTYEAMLGVNFFPVTDLNMFLKGGYRIFEVDDVPAQNTGQLDGGLAMAGLGVSF